MANFGTSNFVEATLPGFLEKIDVVAFDEDLDTNGLRRFTLTYKFKGTDKQLKKVFTFLKDPRTGAEDVLANGNPRIGVHNG